MKYKGLLILLISLILAGVIQSCKMEKMKNETTLFVGTYTADSSEGIYTFRFNRETGRLLNQKLVATMKNPSFLKLAPDKNTLYAVSEVDDYQGDNGSITSFRVKDKVLEKLNTQSTYGANPCHIGINSSADYITVANYTGGNLSIFKTESDGSLSLAPQVIDHKVLDSSKTAHAHMASFLNGELLVADLGLDRIQKYRLDNGEFLPSEQPALILPEGAGPRHFTSSRDGEYLYVINELNSTLTVFKNEGEKYVPLEAHETVASDYKGESFCADIHLSPDGNYLYGSNRGENTIVIFKVDKTSGKLTFIGRESVKGDWPRNFVVDTSGEFLLVANQRSNNIVVFKRDIQNGTLSFSSEVELSSPVCLEFY